MLKIEAQLSTLKSYIDCELSTLTSKIDAFSDSLKHALPNLQKRESNYAKTDLLQQNITLLKNELKSKDRIIKWLLETQNTLTNSLSILNTIQDGLFQGCSRKPHTPSLKSVRHILQ